MILNPKNTTVVRPASPSDSSRDAAAEALNAKLQSASGNRLLSRLEFCAMLNISVSTSERWDRISFGPRPIKIGPRRIGYRVADVISFIESRRTSEAEAA